MAEQFFEYFHGWEDGGDGKRNGLGTGAHSIDTALKRSGRASLRVNPTADSYYEQFGNAQPNQNHLALGWEEGGNARVSFRFRTLPASGSATIFQLEGNSRNPCFVAIKSDGALELWTREGGGFGTDTLKQTTAAGLVVIDTWYDLEIEWIDLDVPGSASIEVYLNEVVVLSQTALTLNSLSDDVFYVDVGVISSETCDVNFDDIAIANTGHIGNGAAYLLVPIGAGAEQDWDVSDFAQVDDYATGASDGATTQATEAHVQLSGQKDILWTLEDLPAVSEVKMVAIRCHNPTLAGAGGCQYVMRNAGGDIRDGGTVATTINAWIGEGVFGGGVVNNFSLSPFSDAQWTVDEVNGLQLGLLIGSASTTGNYAISAMGLAVWVVPLTRVVTVSPVVSYFAFTRTGPNNTPWRLTFTVTDTDGATDLTYEVWTDENRAGTMVASGDVTLGVEQFVDIAYNAPGLVNGNQTLYLHIVEGA